MNVTWLCKSTSVQLKAWCHHPTSHYQSQCWPRSTSPYGITRPQWVVFISETRQLLHVWRAVHSAMLITKYQICTFVWLWMMHISHLLQICLNYPQELELVGRKSIMSFNWYEFFISTYGSRGLCGNSRFVFSIIPRYWDGATVWNSRSGRQVSAYPTWPIQ